MIEPSNERNAGNAVTESVWTVQKILEWTTVHLGRHGSESPRLDAEILLAHARGCRRIELYTRYADVLSEAERATMRELVQRRAKAEPVAYLVGQKEFFGLTFAVNSAVLIPRPDTEVLVMEAIARLKIAAAAQPPSPRVLELGTGSGCIAIALATRVPGALITAVDISPAALAVAHQNAARHNVQDRITFVESDGYSALSAASAQAGESQKRFQMIVSNPPYIPTDEIPQLDADVHWHEPHLALDGGRDGLGGLRLVAGAAADWLEPGGWMLCEIGCDQADASRNLLQANGQFTESQIIRDLAGRPRVIAAQLQRSIPA